MRVRLGVIGIAVAVTAGLGWIMGSQAQAVPAGPVELYAVPAGPGGAADILRSGDGGQSWDRWFDGSDVLVERVTAMHVLSDRDARTLDPVLLVVDQAVPLPGVGTVTPRDIVRFDPLSLGEDTVGTFSVELRGADVGLDRDHEAVDALTVLADGRLAVSVAVRARLPGEAGTALKVKGEDLAVLTPGPSPVWEVLFDGSDVRLRKKGENVNGAWVDPRTGELHLVATEGFKAGTFAADPADVASFAGTLGPDTSGTLSLYRDGDPAASPLGPINAWSVAYVNREPVAADDAFAIDEDVPLVGNLFADNGHGADADPDGDALTVTITSGPAHGSLGPIAADGSFTYTPDPDFNGSDGFEYEIDDHHGGTDRAVVTIAIAAVNDPPSFTGGADQTTLEDRGRCCFVNNWVSDVSPGPADESSQGIQWSFTQIDGPTITSDLPRMLFGPHLSYRPAPNAFGTATFEVVATDDGGGDDTSPPHEFTITVTPVNDRPSFQPGPEQFVDRNAGPQTVPAWATHISPGPDNESDQDVTFEVAGPPDPSLFRSAPDVSPDGTLTYEPAGVAGTAVMDVYAVDDGGTADGGIDRSFPRSLRITLTEPPVAQPDSYETEFDTPLSVDAAAGVLANDHGGHPAAQVDHIVFDGTTAPAGTTLSPLPGHGSGSLRVRADGSFDVTPPDGFRGLLAFDYLARNEGGESTASTSILVESAPEVVATDPADQATMRGAAADMTVEFSEPVTVSGDWFVLDCDGQTYTPTGSGGSHTVTVVDANPVFTLDPDQDLALGATCALTVHAAAVADADTVDPPDNPSADHVVTFGVAPVASGGSFDSLGNVGIDVPAGDGLAAGAGPGVEVHRVQGETGNVGAAAATDQGGEVTVVADGSFVYAPAPGFEGSDTFTYVLAAGGHESDPATVTIQVDHVIWFVDGTAGAPGDGTLASPFASPAGYESVRAGGGVDDGDHLYLGDGTYTDSIVMVANQKLVGEGAGAASLAGLLGVAEPPHSRPLPPVGGVRPRLEGAQVVMAGDVLVQGVDLGGGAAPGAKLAGGRLRATRVHEVAVTGAGPAVRIVGGLTGEPVPDIQLDSVESTSSSTTVIELLSLNGGRFAVTGPVEVTDATQGIRLSSVRASVEFGDVSVTGGAGVNIRDSGPVSMANLDAVVGGAALETLRSTFHLGGSASRLETTGPGPILNIDDTDLGAAFSLAEVVSADVASDHSPVRMRNVSSPVSIAGGHINARGGGFVRAFDVWSQSADFTYGGAITARGGAGAMLFLDPGGPVDPITLDFGGPIESTGAGVQVLGTPGFNAGAVTRFRGLLTLNTGANQAFSVEGSGVVEVTGTGNTIGSASSPVTARAVRIEDVDIGPAGVTFESIHTDVASPWPEAIELLRTGTQGRFQIVGDGTGARNGSGGRVASSTGLVVVMTDAEAPSFSSVDLVGTNGFRMTGLRGETVIRGCNIEGAAFRAFDWQGREDGSGLVVDDCAVRGVRGSGQGVVFDTDDFAGSLVVRDSEFNGIHFWAVRTTGRDATVRLLDNVFHNDDGIQVPTSSGQQSSSRVYHNQFEDGQVASHLEVVGNTFRGVGRLAGSDGEAVLNVSTATATLDMVVEGNTFSDIPVDAAMNLRLGPGELRGLVAGNVVGGQPGAGLVVSSPSNGPDSFDLTIRDNVLGAPGDPIGTNLRYPSVWLIPSATTGGRLSVTGNRVVAFSDEFRATMEMNGRGSIDATFRANSFVNEHPAARALELDARDGTVLCLDMNGPAAAGDENVVTAPTSSVIFGDGTSLFSVAGLTGGTDSASVAAFLESRNTFSRPLSVFGGPYDDSRAACDLPVQPAIP